MDKLDNRIVFGYENYNKDEGYFVDNCIDFKCDNLSPCDTGGVIFETFRGIGGISMTIDDIHKKNISNYIYPVSFRFFAQGFGIDKPWEWNEKSNKIDGKTFFSKISDKVLEDLRTKKAKLFLYYPFEGTSVSSGSTILALYPLLLDLLKEYNLPIDNVSYCDSNLYIKKHMKEMNVFPVNYCALTYNEWNVMDHKFQLYHGKNSRATKNKKRILRKELRPKYFLSYNRIPKQHRTALVLSLFKNNLLDKGLVSFPQKGMAGYDIVHDERDWLKRNHISYVIQDGDILDEYENYSDRLNDKLPLLLDKEDMSVCWSVTPTPFNHYFDTYFSIVTESIYREAPPDNMELFISEKIWKPIMNYHPFILVANPGSIKQLKEYGFKTFHPFIDESYDDCLSNQERFLSIEKEIKKLCSLSIEELHDWYWSVMDILEHNYFHFYNVFIPDQYKQLRIDFENILEG